MKLWSRLFLAGMLVCASAHAEKPTDASVKELLTLANSQQIIRNVEAQMDGMMKSTMKTAMKDQAVNEAQQKVLDKFKDKVLDIHRKEMRWENLEPIFVRIYSNSLTQEDVDGIIAFYKSPAGKSFISKMPVMMQQTTGEMQKLMTPMIEKMLEASKEMTEELHKLEKQ